MTRRKTLEDKAMLALKKAVKDVVERHKKSGRPLSVWKKGKVVKIKAR